MCLLSSPSRSLTNPAHLEQQQIQIQDFATDTPTLREHLVARLREIKGDSSGVNYPGFTPQEQPDGTAIGAQNLSKVFGNSRRQSNKLRHQVWRGLWSGANGAGKTTIKMFCGLLPLVLAE